MPHAAQLFSEKASRDSAAPIARSLGLPPHSARLWAWSGRDLQNVHSEIFPGLARLESPGSSRYSQVSVPSQALPHHRKGKVKLGSLWPHGPQKVVN
jgi:hypothetical protein